MKQAIILRKDLKMSTGKLISQACHASLASFLKSNDLAKNIWLNEGMKKIVLKVSKKSDLIDLYKKAKKDNLPCELIEDRGLTQIESGSITALGIGPADDSKIDKITGKLKLL